MNGMFCKRCGVGKISKHYGVGHGSVPCRPLFLTKMLNFFGIWLASQSFKTLFLEDIDQTFLKTIWGYLGDKWVIKKNALNELNLAGTWNENSRIYFFV